MANAQAKQRPRANMTSVIPQGPPATPPEVDTTTPADTSVIPYTQLHTPKWGQWLAARLHNMWPHLNSTNYLGYINQHIVSNESLLIRSKYAILLAVLTYQVFTPRPMVDIVFCFKHHPDNDEQNKDVRLLLRAMEAWGRSHGARYVRVLDRDKLDTTFSRTKEVLRSEVSEIFLTDLDK